MSIDDLIHQRVQDGLLRPFIPRRARALRRALFLSEELWKVLENKDDDEEMQVRLGDLEADLGLFVEQRKIDPKYLFLLSPTRDSVWEIRSVRPTPTIRVLGLFAARDVFVATNHGLREELGGWESMAWKKVKRTAAQRWHGLFHPFLPRRETDARKLVTGAISGKYFKGRA